MSELHKAEYVARYLGVSKMAVLGWADTPTPKFPLPVHVLVESTRKPGVPLWASEQLPELREWLGARLNIRDPKKYWRTIDDGRTPTPVDMGQTEFDFEP